MRLSKHEKEIIVSCTKDKLGKNSRIILFGSRTDDNRKGGDIDLLIQPGIQASQEEMLKKKIFLLLEIERKLGEQNIDIIIQQSNDQRKIVNTALITGIVI